LFAQTYKPRIEERIEEQSEGALVCSWLPWRIERNEEKWYPSRHEPETGFEVNANNQKRGKETARKKKKKKERLYGCGKLQ
jgi:hypothetical protein